MPISSRTAARTSLARRHSELSAYTKIPIASIEAAPRDIQLRHESPSTLTPSLFILLDDDDAGAAEAEEEDPPAPVVVVESLTS